METSTDIQNMLRFRDGDAQAFTSLFVKYRKKIINYCYRFFSNQEVAEELAQEVFMKVYKSAQGYRPDAAFSTWLFRIATNVCLNELRKKRYHSTTDSLDAPLFENSGHSRDIEDSTSQPHEIIESQERDEMVKNAILKLPGKQRAALLLRTYNGFSYNEIAMQLGSTESGVKSLIFRGRESLKETLQSYFKEER